MESKKNPEKRKTGSPMGGSSKMKRDLNAPAQREMEDTFPLVVAPELRVAAKPFISRQFKSRMQTRQARAEQVDEAV
uniref:Uncharacterized protein n=1 Tax=Sphaerodactylus townsendi TaxID=933632 RepID=A0ACB8GAH2_9SAUR